jgi:hypothetical protein
MAGSNPIITMIRAAFGQIGVPYVWGTNDPGTSFDCSGFTQFVLSKVGIGVSHQSTAQSNELSRVNRGGLRPGDLVFFSYGRLGSGTIDHVGIYLGNGLMIDAPNSDSNVEIGPVDWDNFVQGGSVYAELPNAQVPSPDRLRALARNSDVETDWVQAYSKDPKVQSAARVAGKTVNIGGQLDGILRGLGLSPSMFDDLINQAITQQWTPYQFQAELYGSPEFRNTFPGIFNKDGSLKMTAAEYLHLAYGDGGYSDIAREFGIKLDRDRIGALFSGNKSPDEFAFEASVLQDAKHNEVYRQSWNRVLESMGREPLDKADWFDFVAGRTNAKIENLHEAATLLGAEGLVLSPEQARAASKQIGETGEQVDLKALVSQVRDIKDFVGPELRSAGITDADLAVLESGADPKAISQRLQQIVRNRQALVGASLGGTSAFPAIREGL